MATQEHAHDSHLTRLHEYKVEDSNMELVGTDVDHKVKYASAETEPAWKGVGGKQGLHIWRIEDFEIVPWPSQQYGSFFNGDSYIVLNTYKATPDAEALSHDIHFWLGSETSQDEAGVAAYKTVELDEHLHGAATQYRSAEGQESPRFLALFPRLTILRGGVRSGFTHVVPEETSLFRLLQITASGKAGGILVREVEADWKSLSSSDVFVLDEGKKGVQIWQGAKCSPMEKNKAAQVISQMAAERGGQVDTEVISQTESRSLRFIQALHGDVSSNIPDERPKARVSSSPPRPVRLFRLSDASGTLQFDLIKNGEKVSKSDFKSDDVFIYDSGTQIYVWQGRGASQGEKAMWLKVAQAYLRSQASPTTASVAKVVEGHEGAGFVAALGA